MKVSVITPTYNRPDYLRQAVESFEMQDYEDKELIVINDGGSEEQSIYREIAEKHTYIYKPHTNQSDTQNVGIEKSTGELLCTLDDDDMLFDQYSLSKRVEAFTDDIEVVWCGAVDVWQDGKLSTEHPVDKEPDIWNRDTIFIQSLMYRKSIKEKIGGYFFDDDLTSNEDWDFKIRLLEECKYLPLDFIGIKHRIHGEMRSNQHRISGELGENENKFRVKLNKRYGK